MERKDLKPLTSKVYTEISLETGESLVLETPNWIGRVAVVETRKDEDRRSPKARLGIMLPKEVPVHRGEIFDILSYRRSV